MVTGMADTKSLSDRSLSKQLITMFDNVYSLYTGVYILLQEDVHYDAHIPEMLKAYEGRLKDLRVEEGEDKGRV